MNRKGVNLTLGFIFVVLGIIFVSTSFALIEPLKESLDNNRGGDTLNCPGAPSFNQTDYSDDTGFERLTRRPTCFVTGISMVWFIGAFILSVVVWIAKQWERISR